MRRTAIEVRALLGRVSADLTDNERFALECIEQGKPFVFDKVYMPAIINSALRKLAGAGCGNVKAELWLRDMMRTAH